MTWIRDRIAAGRLRVPRSGVLGRNSVPRRLAVPCAVTPFPVNPGLVNPGLVNPGLVNPGLGALLLGALFLVGDVRSQEPAFTPRRGGVRLAQAAPPAAGELPPPQAGRISLVVDRQPLSEALEIFLRQKPGFSVTATPQARDQLVSANIQDVAPLDALAMLASSNHLWYELERGTGRYVLHSADETRSRGWSIEALRQLEREVNDAFPESVVKLALVGQQIVVRGQAKDTVEAARIIKVLNAEAVQGPDGPRTPPAIAPGSMPSPWGIGNQVSALETDANRMPGGGSSLQVIDMLTVQGQQQVMLRVTVAEVNRSAARSIGLNFSLNNNSGGNVFQQNTGSVASNMPVLLDQGQIKVAINALRKHALSRTLAEPTLTALNGEEASFHAGGQFPVPVMGPGFGGGNLQSVNFIPFGVQLRFSPWISDATRIRLAVAAEVSSQDPKSGTSLGGSPDSGGTAVSGLSMRKFETTVELEEGQTLAVAGLIQNTYNATADRVPFFGDLPLIGRGAAFDTSTQTETELVILITPELVQGVDKGMEPALPGSDLFEPSNIEFYLGGRLEGTRARDYRSSARTDCDRRHGFAAGRDAYIIGPTGYSALTHSTKVPKP